MSQDQAQDGPAPDDGVAIAEGITQRRVGGQVFVLMPDSKMHVLENDTAVELWERLREAGAEGCRLDALAESLTHRYRVSHETALADVVAFAHRLRDAGVLLVRTGAGAGEG